MCMQFIYKLKLEVPENIYARVYHSSIFCMVHMVPEYKGCALAFNEARYEYCEKQTCQHTEAYRFYPTHKIPSGEVF